MRICKTLPVLIAAGTIFVGCFGEGRVEETPAPDRYTADSAVGSTPNESPADSLQSAARAGLDPDRSTAPAADSPLAIIEVGTNGFDPSFIVIQEGTRVRWITRGGSSHRLADEAGIWGEMHPGPNLPAEHLFTRRVLVDYRCLTHGQRGSLSVLGSRPRQQDEAETVVARSPLARLTDLLAAIFSPRPASSPDGLAGRGASAMPPPGSRPSPILDTASSPLDDRIAIEVYPIDESREVLLEERIRNLVDKRFSRDLMDYRGRDMDSVRIEAIEAELDDIRAGYDSRELAIRSQIREYEHQIEIHSANGSWYDGDQIDRYDDLIKELDDELDDLVISADYEGL